MDFVQKRAILNGGGIVGAHFCTALAVIMGLAVGTTQTAFAAGSTPAVPVRQTSGGTDALLLCDLPGFKPCDNFRAEIGQVAQEQIARVLDNAYRNLSPTQVTLPVGRTLQLPTIQMRTPVCNLMNRAWNAGAEIATNHTGQACGQNKCQVNCVRISPNQLRCEMPNYSQCETERSWVRGAYVQMAWNAAAQVKDELTSRSAISLKGECEAPALHPSFGSQVRALQLVSAELEALTGQATPSCQGLGDAISNATPGEQRACYLSAVRRALELILADAMVCETLRRADETWFTERNRLNELTKNRFNAIIADKTCEQYNNDPAQLTTCVNNAYNSAIENDFRAAMGGYSRAP